MRELILIDGIPFTSTFQTRLLHFSYNFSNFLTFRIFVVFPKFFNIKLLSY